MEVKNSTDAPAMPLGFTAANNHTQEHHHSHPQTHGHHHAIFSSISILIIIISIASIAVIFAIFLIILMLRRLKSAKTNGTCKEHNSITSSRFVAHTTVTSNSSPGNDQLFSNLSYPITFVQEIFL
jgi:heme/copper-type cytochrome/quinol oxidase subunit 2